MVKAKKNRGKKEGISDSFDSLELNGNYFWDLDLSIWRKLWLFLDLMIFAVIYIILSFLLSWVLDKYTVRELDRNQNDVVIVLEIISQLLFIVLILYVVIIMLGRYIPDLYPDPPLEHITFKGYTLTVLIIFGLFAGEYKFQDKIRYLFSKKKDSRSISLTALAHCYERRDFGFLCEP